MADYCDSCRDYMEYIQHPLPDFHCDDWNEQFSNWSAVQFWVYVVAGILWILVGVWYSCHCVGTMAAHFCVGVLVAYIQAHFGWYIIVFKGGCCHPAVCAVFGILYLLHGINWAVFAIFGHFHINTGLHYTPAMADQWGWHGHLIRRILYGIYAIALIYMGVAAIMICASGQAGAGYGSREVELDDLESASTTDRPRGRVTNGRVTKVTTVTEEEVPLTDRR